MTTTSTVLAPPADDQALRLQILGPLRLWRGTTEFGGGPRQQAELLALLLARIGRPTSTNQLIDLIWEEDPPASAVNILHKYVGGLRRLLEPALPPRAAGSFIVRRGTGYLLTADAAVLDLADFRRLSAAARSHAEAGRRQLALDCYVQALKLWRGRAGDGMASGPTATVVFTALDDEFLRICARATRLALETGAAEQMIEALRLAAAMAPLNEPVQADLITVLAACGQQAQALQHFQSVRSRLSSDLGIAPGPVLTAAQHQVLTQAASRPTKVPVKAAGKESVRSSPARSSSVRVPVAQVAPAQLPPALSAFTGRAGELSMLTGLLTDLRADTRTSPLIVVLDGPAGYGKSTLATYFAQRVLHDFPDGQLYLDLRGNQQHSLSSTEALSLLSGSLGTRALDEAPSPAARAGTFRSLSAGKRVLILLDNARDLSQVRPLLPNSARSLVLITSRRPLTGLAALEGAVMLRVGLPDPESARKLIERRLQLCPDRSLSGASTPTVLDEIVELCGRLPAALAILAGRLSARPTLSLETVVAELRDEKRRLSALASGDGVTDPRSASAWSYQQLQPQTARAFRLMSLAFPQRLSVEACASLAGCSLSQARRYLQELVEATLLEEDQDRRFAVHVLVGAYAREICLSTDPPAERDAAAARLVQHYLRGGYAAA